MDKSLGEPEQFSVAASVAPEDLRPRDYIAVLHEATEVPSFFWRGSDDLTPWEPVRIWHHPTETGPPLRIHCICLPFLFVETPERSFKTLDLRRARIARLTEHYGRRAWKALRGKPAR